MKKDGVNFASSCVWRSILCDAMLEMSFFFSPRAPTGLGTLLHSPSVINV